MVGERHYDVIVIGAGPGGLACAARLQAAGVRTLLVEQADHPGGKAVTVTRRGFSYELGPKLQVPMRGPAFATLFDELGMAERLRQIMLVGASSHSYRRGGGDYVTSVNREARDGVAFMDGWGLDEGGQRIVLDVMAGLMGLGPAVVAELDDVTMAEYIDTLPEVPDQLYDYLAMFSNAGMAEPVDRACASEQIRLLQQIATHGGGGYYEGGFGRMLGDIADAFVAAGGTFRTGTRVERVLTAEGRATGIATDGGDFTADVVVSDAGIQPTVLKLVGEEHFERDYVDRVRRLEPGWGWASVRYFVDRPVVPVRMATIYADDTWWDSTRYDAVYSGEVVPDEVLVFLTVPVNFDPTMAPPGTQCIVAGTMCPPDPQWDGIGMLYDRIDATLRRIYPDLMDAVERREVDGPAEVSRHTRDQVVPRQGGECVGVGQIVGQCGRHKPSPVSPLPGLYFCGADVASWGMGTHLAADSGLKVADLVRHALVAT